MALLLAVDDQSFAQSVAYGIAAWGPWITGAAIVLFCLTFVTDAQWKAIIPKFDPQPPGPGPSPNPSPVNVDTLTDEAKQFIERRKRIEAEIVTLESEKVKLTADIDAKIASKKADIAQGEALINGVTA